MSKRGEKAPKVTAVSIVGNVNMNNGSILSMIIILQVERKMSLFLGDACEVLRDEVALQQKSGCEAEYTSAWFLTTGESDKYRKGEEARINPGQLDWNWGISMNHGFEHTVDP